MAIECPQVQDIYGAALRLGLNPVEEKNSRYPRFCWEKAGNVLVDKKGKKSVLISNIAEEMKSYKEKVVNLRQ
jgi:signal recognition particle subunit SEC65